MAQLAANHFEVTHDSNQGSDVVIVNTCGFIKDAKQESIDTILQFIKAREEGLIRKLYVMGCLSERYRDDLILQIPEVDRYFGVNNLQEIINEIGGIYRSELIGERYLSTPSHYAYLKISEGCNRKCTFCAIPSIRGKHRSKTLIDLMKEAASLASKGIKELILIAQDLSYYGIDIYHKPMLPLLVEELSKIEGIQWIRLHYAYPAGFPKSILPILRDNDKVCKYLDIPIQHINNRILSLMQRGHSKEQTINLLEGIRKEVPGIALRTTIIVGFPGETRQEFEELLSFMRDFRFDRLGAFPYSHEEGTKAYKLPDNIPLKIKNDRINRLMDIQQEISLDLNQKKRGIVLKTLIDRKEGELYFGRTEADSPEIDNEVIVEPRNRVLTIGEFYPVLISKADYFDVSGEVCH